MRFLILSIFTLGTIIHADWKIKELCIFLTCITSKQLVLHKHLFVPAFPKLCLEPRVKTKHSCHKRIHLGSNKELKKKKSIGAGIEAMLIFWHFTALLFNQYLGSSQVRNWLITQIKYFCDKILLNCKVLLPKMQLEQQPIALLTFQACLSRKSYIPRSFLSSFS